MSERCKDVPAAGSGKARPADGAGANSDSQLGNATVAIRVPYDAVVVGKAYLVDPEYAQANDDMIFLVLAKSPLPEEYYMEQDPEKRARIERNFLVDGVYFYRQNETACGVHHVDAKKLQRAGGSGEPQEELPHDPNDNRLFVRLPDGIKWNSHRLFLCCNKLGLWRTNVKLRALMRPVEVRYKRPREPVPHCGEDEYFFSQVHGEDFAKFINYYPEVPPESEDEAAETREQLRQLYGTKEGSGAPRARGAQGGAGPSTSAGPSGVLPAQPQPSPSAQPSVIPATSSDEDTSGEEGDVGQGPAGSEDDGVDGEEGNSDDDDFVLVPRPGRGSGPAIGGGSGGAGEKLPPGARGLPALRSRIAPQSGRALGTARATLSPMLHSRDKQQQQQQQGGGARSKGHSKKQLLALPELGLLARAEVSDEATAHIHLVPHRTAQGRKVEGPLVVDGVQVPRADDPASRPFRKGDKLIMHVCSGMGGASLHGRVNVQEERAKAVEERRKLRERKKQKAQDGGTGAAGSEGGVGARSGGAGPGGSGGCAGPSESGTGVAITGGSKAGSAASGGGRGAAEVAGVCSGKGSDGAQVRLEQMGTAGFKEIEDAPDVGPRTRSHRDKAADLSSRHAGTPAPRPGAGAGPAEAGAAPTAGPRVPRTVGAGSGSGGDGGSGSGACSDGEGDELSGSGGYSGVVTAGCERNRADAGAAAVAAAGEGVGVPLESVMTDIPTDDEGCIRLVNGFACDISRSALQTFLANNPAVGMLCRATELFVLLQLFDKLVRWAQPVRPAFETAEAARAASGGSPSSGRAAGRQQQQRQQHAKPGVGKGPKKAKGKAGGKEECIVADVLGMRLCHAVPVAGTSGQLALGERELATRDCWLEFLVEWEYYKGWDNYPEGRYQWVRLEEMSGFTELLARFVLRLRAERLLPLPGDVFCLVAGPPCQNMSGFNQFANKIEVMKDTKNRIVLSVLSIVEHLRPPFALLEQVVDAGKKDAAVWLRTVQGTYMEMEYQQRTGLMFAASSGAAEGRPRLFVWAADTGYVLPAFPRPTHEKNHLPRNHLRVLRSQEFKYVVAGKDSELLPGSVLGDVMWGVESVDNWCMTPLARTRGCPRTVLQHLLSRPPPDSTSSAEERAAVYLGLTTPVQLELALALLEARDAFVRQKDKLLETEAERRALLEEARAALAEQLAVRGRAGSGRRRGQGGAGGSLTEADLQKHIDDMAAIHVARMVLAEFPEDDSPAEEYIGKDVDRSGARKAGQDDGESEEESQEDDSADDGDAYEGETFMVQSTMDMAHRDLGVRLLSGAQRAVSDARKFAGPTLELLRAMLPACDGRQEVGSAGQEAAATAAGGAQGQGGGAAGRVADGTPPASGCLEVAAGGAGAAPGGGHSTRGGSGSVPSGNGYGGYCGGCSGGGVGGDAARPLTQLLHGRLTNHFPAMLTPTEEHRVMCVPPHTDDPTTERPSFRRMKGPICGNCTALWEPIMTPTVRKCNPKCASKTPYGRWGRREVIHTIHGGCKPYCACVLPPDAHRTLTMRECMSAHSFPYYYVLTAYEGLFCRTGQYQGLLSRRDAVLGPAVEGLDWAARAVGAQGDGAGAAGATRSGGGDGAAVPGGGTAGAAGGAPVPPLAFAAGTRKSAYRKITVDVDSGVAGAQGTAKQGAMTRLKDALQRLQRLGAKMQKQVGDSVCPLVAEGLSRELLRAASLAVEDGGRSGLGPEWSAGLGASKAVREAWEWRCERPEERMGGRERSNGEGLVKGGEGEQEDEQRLKAELGVREPEEDSSSEEEDTVEQQEDYSGMEDEEGQEDGGEDENDEDEGEGETEEEVGQDETGEHEEDEGEVDEGEEVGDNEGGDSGGDDTMEEGEEEVGEVV